MYAQNVGELQAVPETVSVPFLDLARTNGPLKDAILADIAGLIDSNAFTNGPQVANFEEAWAEFCGTRFCVGLASGLDALRLALIALELKPGDEVIIPANTFVASAEAVTQAGGRPVLVDASEADWNVDVDAVDAAVSPRTRAVMPVHLYGQMADMVALREIAERRSVALVEDACQAHGATRDGLRSGASGAAGAFSFYPGKNLGAFGDAGALVSDEPSCIAAVRSLREHGQRAKYEHERIGFTARLDSVQALVLLAKLPFLEAANDARRVAASHYAARLSGVGDLRLPPVPAGSNPVWHLFVIRTSQPRALAEFLATRGIGTGRHYPHPVHITGAFNDLGPKPGAFRVSEAIAKECLSLPIYPGISEEEIEAVVSGINSFFTNGQRQDARGLRHAVPAEA